MASRAAIVTGAAGGIGSATCLALRAAGYHVVGVDRQAPADGTCDRFVAADLAEAGAGEAAAEALLARIVEATDDRPIGLLVNNAAVQALGLLADISVADWLTTLHVNVSAPFLLSRGLARKLAEAAGAIINVGSVHAQATKPEFAAYATSKAALHGLTRALAVDLGPKVRVLTIAPAAVSTPMLRAGFEGRPEAFAELERVHPAGRIAAPEEVARAIVWLASDEAGFMTGATLWMDGGILSRLHDPV